MAWRFLYFRLPLVQPVFDTFSHCSVDNRLLLHSKEPQGWDMKHLLDDSRHPRSSDHPNCDHLLQLQILRRWLALWLLKLYLPSLLWFILLFLPYLSFGNSHFHAFWISRIVIGFLQWTQSILVKSIGIPMHVLLLWLPFLIGSLFNYD